jgi:hypothetical protein
MKRRLFPSALSGCVVGLVLSVGLSQAGAAPGAAPVPGADESPAVLRESNTELRVPNGPDRLPDLKSQAAGAIAIRQTRLTVLTKLLTSAPAKRADCSQAAVVASLASESAALNVMGQKLASETDLKKGKDNFRRIFIDSRVFLLHNPRAFLAGECLAVQVRSQKLAARLAETPALDPAESTRLAGIVGQVANDSRNVMVPVLALASDHGDKAALAANTAALNTAFDSLQALDAALTDVDTALDAAAPKAASPAPAPANPKVKKDRQGDPKASTTTTTSVAG